MADTKFSKVVLNRVLIARLFSKIKVSTTNFYKGVPCWEWTAFTNPVTGYAQYNIAKIGLFLAHRLIYQLFVEEVPKELQCDHLCRVRHCVNPAHIEPVTPLENGKRGNSIATFFRNQTHCAQGHPFSGDNLSFHFYGKHHKLRRVCKRCHREREAARRVRLGKMTGKRGRPRKVSPLE